MAVLKCEACGAHYLHQVVLFLYVNIAEPKI